MNREEKGATIQPGVMERLAVIYPGYGRFSGSMTWERIGLPAVILGLVAFFTILEPRFFTQTNLTNIGRQVSILALASWGQTLVILSAGIDLSVGAVVALVSVVMGLTFKSLGPVPGIFAGLLAGALVGLFNGLIAGKTRVTPFVVTLASLSIVRGLALTITGGVPVWDFPDSIVYVIGNGYFLGIPIPIYVAGIGFILVWCLLYLTPFGTRLYAVGGNEEAALLAGVNIPRIKIAAYTISGLFAGVGGVVLTLRVQSGQPLLGSGLELQTIAAVVIGGTSLFGGKGSLVGSLYGVVIIGILANGLDILGVSSFVQQIIIGATTLGAVLFTTVRRGG